MSKPELHIKKTDSPTLVVYDHHITPVSQVVMVKWSHGALLWHGPAAVEVRQGKDVQRLPIHNTTRRIIIAMTLAGLLSAVVVRWLLRSRYTLEYV